MDVTIEHRKDAEVIARLNQHVHQPHSLRQQEIFAPYDHHEALTVVQGLLAKDNSYGLIAYKDKEPVGYAIVLRRDYPPGTFRPGHRSLFIDQMAVRPDCQGQGIGEQLIEAVADMARAQGIKRIELNVWADNEGAKRFYGRCGFKTYTENMYREL